MSLFGIAMEYAGTHTSFCSCPANSRTHYSNNKMLFVVETDCLPLSKGLRDKVRYAYNPWMSVSAATLSLYPADDSALRTLETVNGRQQTGKERRVDVLAGTTPYGEVTVLGMSPCAIEAQGAVIKFILRVVKSRNAMAAVSGFRRAQTKEVVPLGLRGCVSVSLNSQFRSPTDFHTRTTRSKMQSELQTHTSEAGQSVTLHHHAAMLVQLQPRPRILAQHQTHN